MTQVTKEIHQSWPTDAAVELVPSMCGNRGNTTDRASALLDNTVWSRKETGRQVKVSHVTWNALTKNKLGGRDRNVEGSAIIHTGRVGVTLSFLPL